MKTKPSQSTDAVEDAIAKALEAAAAATDAAHEAEAVLTSRSEAAEAMKRTARNSGLLAAVAGGAAVLVLALGGMLWLRTSADLRDAGEVQAAASVAFVERLAEMNKALDRLDQIVIGLDAENAGLQSRLSALVEELGARVEEIRTTPDAAPRTDMELVAQIERLRADMVEAIAETQISISEQLLVQAATTPAPVAKVPAPVAQPPAKPARKPAPRPPAPKRDTNPFRYP